MAGPESFVLDAADPLPVEVVGADGRAPIVLTCEHGGRAVPLSLSDRAPPAADMARHIAWDLGAAEVARSVADQLNAALFIQRYSRLVIDCNRPFIAPDLAPAVSDASPVPFNTGLTQAVKEARWEAIHQPYHRAVADRLDSAGAVSLVAIHSFTPRLRGGALRHMAAGLLARKNRGLAIALMREMEARAPDLPLAFDLPYRIEDESDYTIPVHGERRGLPHVLLEIRNDLIADAKGVAFWSGLVSEALAAACAALDGE